MLLILLSLRLTLTYVEPDNKMKGPIRYTRGFLQGGCTNDRIYHLVNNEELDVVLRSELGVDLGLDLDCDGALRNGVILSRRVKCIVLL